MACLPLKHDEPHNIAEKVEFTVLTSEQVKELAVVKIRTSATIDPLGHPVPGGLYDPLMGPITERFGSCATCSRYLLHCPGHIGYVDLALPIVNPMFHKIIGLIIRTTCLSCYHIQIPAHIKHSIVTQMNLLRCGFTSEAQEVENMIRGLVAVHGSLEEIPEHADLPIKMYENMVKREQLAQSNGDSSVNKNIQQLRNECIYSMFAQVKRREVCIFCKSRINRIQAMKSKIIMHTRETDMSQSIDRFDISGRGVFEIKSRYINPDESRKFLRQIWIEENEIMQHLLPVLSKVDADYPTDCLFMDVLIVTPPNCRAVNVVNGRITEHSQTLTYREIMQYNQMLSVVIRVAKHQGDIKELSLPKEVMDIYNLASGDSPLEKLNNTWIALQTRVDYLLDRESSNNKTDIYQGFKQMLEKKHGLLRNNMMGKRVNYAARSVIAPDPYLGVDEIGVPKEIAKSLTYPESVTPLNVTELRKMVMNGPDVHPGAKFVEFENGNIVRINPKDATQRSSLAKRLLTPDEDSREVKGFKKVHRHLRTGDVVLANRQPTLHKPSIMAHKVRVLMDEKTLRLHYSNCKAYNADFDGDEMNIHLPQTELGRSEAFILANVSNNYLGPKDGSPLGGLIQDHVISGVKLTIRGRFYNKSDYQALIYEALAFKKKEIELLPPAIIKPVKMWSGKQVFSTVLMNIIPDGKPKINLTSVAKISDKAWVSGEPRPWNGGGTEFSDTNKMSESEVIIRNGELLCGVLDKQHYGATAYGLVHCVFELYGGTVATRLLSSLSKMFTFNLLDTGFTTGVRDILLTPSAEKKRKRLLKKVNQTGTKTITSLLSIPEDTPLEEITKKVAQETFTNDKFTTSVDRGYKSVVDKCTNQINKRCMPNGLYIRFPKNHLQLMVQSGAKGSMVNTMQISCLLGQIELEGKRPPRMINGKFLASFLINDFSPLAGGFIGHRFLTGITADELFFHCMAGREGLIDTAVKTSRSGYLQRCLVKHLEGVKVEYDLTVRDSDGIVLQFLYGGDGMAVTKTQFLNEKLAKFLVQNAKAIINKDVIKQLKDEEQANIKTHNKMIDEWKKTHSDPLKKRRTSPFTAFCEYIKESHPDNLFQKDILDRLWRNADSLITNQFINHCSPCLDPLNAVFKPDVHFGALNDKLKDLIDNNELIPDKKEHTKFKNIIKLKSMEAMVAPGEPVGLLAAQSIGEPSTQMTLNTFHFAGRGEMNVTLGIPRLREILMMASKNIKTPSMEIPFLDIPNIEEYAVTLRNKFTRVVVSDVLEDVDVHYSQHLIPDRQWKFKLRFNFLPPEYFSDRLQIKPKRIIKHMTRKFFTQLFASIMKRCKQAKNMLIIDEGRSKPGKMKKQNDEEGEENKEQPDNINNTGAQENKDDDSDEDPEDPEDARQGAQVLNRRCEQEPEEEEEKGVAMSEDEGDEEATGSDTKRDDTEEQDIAKGFDKSHDFTFDKKSYSWCEISFGLPLNFTKNLLKHIIRDVAEKSVIKETPNIKNAIITKERIKDNNEEKEVLMLKTEGINIPEIFKFPEFLDLNKIYCNDIHKIAETYGIEAANRAIVKEVKNVFNVYGIPVDTRHLTLIADYMTSSGAYLPMNRKGMESSASPFQQMTFESALTSLKQSVIGGKVDNLTSPSSCIMTGKLAHIGTGLHEVYYKTDQEIKL